MDLFDRVTRLFEVDLKVPHGNVCRLRCDARYKRPLLPWHVGDLYESDARRLVIVGRPQREDHDSAARPAGTRDGRLTAERLYRTKPWPFWRYTREILARVYGSPEDGWRRVVLTTIVKCANAGPRAGGGDATSRGMKESCIRQAGVIREELGLLAPRSILLYTGRDYDEWMERLCWEYRQRWVDRTDRRGVVLCGNLPLPWWEGEIAGGARTVRVLRVGPPQGKPFEDYVARVAAWLRSSP